MSEWNTLTPQARISKWKALREKIKDKSKEEQIQEVADFFRTLPFSSRYLDYYSPDSWPTPWEILWDTMFCVNTISLMMYYTLYLLGFDDIKVCLIDDLEAGDRYLLPVLDNKYVLNYIPGEKTLLSTVLTNADIVDTYNKDQIRKIV